MEKLEKILKETEDFFYVDDGKIAKLAENLTEHMNNKLYFNPTPLKVNKGTVINGDYSTKNLRQSFFYDCKFKDADYKDASLAGSLFNNTHFDEGDYLNTNLQSCDFRNCNFENIITGLNYTRFSKSIFIGIVKQILFKQLLNHFKCNIYWHSDHLLPLNLILLF